MHMLWGKLVVSMGPSLVSTSMGAAVAALNFGLNFAFSQVGSLINWAQHCLFSCELGRSCMPMYAEACHIAITEQTEHHMQETGMTLLMCVLAVAAHSSGAADAVSDG
jgi:hypothetical protein